MKDKKERIETFIKETIEQEAEEIRRENAKERERGEMPAEIKERIWQKLEENIEEYEQRERYKALSDEDYEALRLGQEMIEKRNTRKKAARRKRRIMFYGGFAAMLAIVIVVNINSTGREERVAQFVTSKIGEREIIKVNSSDENLVIVKEDEEEAYQELGEKFGVRPVQILIGYLDGMYFESMEFDTALQLAELSYSYKNNKIVYMISASYKGSSWGTDVEDQNVNEYVIENKYCTIKIKEYKVENMETKKYSASFEYGGLEYFLVGTMEKDDFETIINNFHFIF